MRCYKFCKDVEVNSRKLLDKTFTDRLSSFERCWSSFLRLLMSLWRSLSRVDKASLLATFGNLKIRNFGYTPSCLQFLRKSMSNFSLYFLYSSFLYFRKSLTLTFPYLCAISLQIFIIFLDNAKVKFAWIKITIFVNRRLSILLWSFSS